MVQSRIPNFSNGFSLVVILCMIQAFHHVRSNNIHDILTASTDFLMESLMQEIDFDSTDEVTEEWKENVDSIIEKYIQKIKTVHNLDQHGIRKREIEETTTITRDYQGVNILSSIEELIDISVQYPTDITLFYKMSPKGIQERYAATLESNQGDPELDMANDMVIYRFEKDRFKMLERVPVMGGVDIESFNIKGVPYIVSAEYDAGTSGRPMEGSVVYRVGNSLERVQILNTKYPMDIAVWDDMNEVYMAVATGQDNQYGWISYEADSLVYRWLGEHFDLITTFKTYNARCVSPFKIGSTMYLAVANHMNNHDETDIDSEIFKYNLNEDRFVSHQKIRTHAAMDIKFFSSGNKRKREHFIVVANYFEVGMDGSKIYETGSIIYKFADDYFVPFQSITLVAATQWLPVTGPHGELVLIVACASGMQTFQYDGWRFVNTEVKYSTSTLGPGISSMRTFMFKGGSVLVVANKKKGYGATDVFNLKFKPTHHLQNFHSEMYKWCQEMHDKINNEDLEKLAGAIQESPKIDDSVVYINKDVTIENARIHKLETSEMKIGNVSMNEDVILELNNFAGTIDKLQNDLEIIEDTINKSMKVHGDNYIQGSIRFENITIICENCKFQDAHVSYLNGENLDRFLHNTVNLMDGLVTSEPLEFESLSVESFQSEPQTFNGHPVSALVSCSKDAYFPGTLELQGTTTLLGGLSVDGKIDGLTFSPKVLLLNEGDQVLDGTITLPWAKIDNLNLKKLNEMDADLLFQGAVRVYGDHTILTSSTLSEVHAEKVKINGPIYGTDLESLFDSALRVCGDQTVDGNWKFEKLKCDTCIIDGLLSGTSLEDFINIKGFEYKIDGDMNFTQPVRVDNLYVNEYFNDISVKDGELDLLLLQPSEKILASGHKKFDNLLVSSELKVSRSFNGIDVTAWNSHKVIEGEVILDGDLKIHGNVFINASLSCGDLRNADAVYSLEKLIKHGVKLENPNFLGSPLTLLGTVEVENLYAEEINGIVPESWVIANSENVQTISALKTFEEGVLVVDSIKLGLINGLNLTKLDNDVLKIHGDQVIEGTVIFNHIKAPSFLTEDCLFGDYNCDDLMLTKEEQNVTGLNLFKHNVSVKGNLSVGDLKVEGLVAGYDLDHIIKDTLFDDGNVRYVEASKIFKGQLKFDNVEVHGEIGSLDMNGLLALLYAKQYTVLEGSTFINQPTKIENFYFTGWLDGIHNEEFGSSWLLNTGNQIIKGNQVFSNIIAEGNIALLSGEVNGWNLEELMNDIVMINEDCSLGSVRFDEVASLGPVILNGKLNNLNISTDIAFAEAGKDIYVHGQKIIKSDFIVDGNLIVKDMEYNINFEKMCEFFLSDKTSSLNLLVEGSVNMVEEPTIVESLNNYNLERIYSNVWMNGRDAEINGHKEFTALNFQGGVEVKGYIDGIDLEWLSQNYLSKTKNQTIQEKVIFQDGVVFERSLTAPSATVAWEICGFRLDFLEQRVLLNGPNQTFMGIPTFEELITEGNLDVEGLVNGYEMDDMLRWDKKMNVLRGKIEVQSVHTKELRLGPYARLQGVDIPLWQKLAVKADDPESIYSIKGTKTFIDAVFKDGISVEGEVDGLKFDQDNIMLLSENQIVTGKKTFIHGNADKEKHALIVDKLEVEGLLNDVDVSDFIKRLAYKNEDIIFTDHKKFTSPMTAEYVTINGLYHGVNLSKIDLDEVPKAYEEIFEQYNNLLSISDYFQLSLSRRAAYVSHYESVQEFKDTELVLLISSHGNDMPDLAVINHKNTIQAVMDIYEWNPYNKTFEYGNIGVNLSRLAYAAPLHWTDPHFLYIEIFNEAENKALDADGCESQRVQDCSTSGYFFDHKFIHELHGIVTNRTTTIAQVILPHQIYCYFLAQRLGQASPILCKRESDDQMIVFQEIPTYKVIEASVGLNENSPYIAVVKESIMQSREYDFNVDIWIFSNEKGNFVHLQNISVEGARSVSSIEHKGISYLAFASGNVPGAIHGFLKIYRLNPEYGQFVEWIDLDVVLPWSVKFSILPTDELVLYVSSENPEKSLMVFIYKGVSGFKELTHTSLAPIRSSISIFAGEICNFIAVSGNGRSQIFKPAFKGL